MTVENISIDVKTNAGDAARQFRSLSDSMRSVRNAASEVQGANNGASSSMNAVSSSASRAAGSSRSAARSIEDVAKSAKKAESPLGNFVSSLKRIAFYRMLRTILKEIAQAIKEGLENVYEWSKAGGDMGRISGSLDRIASAAQQMKNQLGAAFAELIVALEPIILALIELVTKLAEALTWVIDLLSGQQYTPVATKVSKEWKEATKSAKEYRNTILGFDEINRLNDAGESSTGKGTEFEYKPMGIELGDFWKDGFEWLSRFNDEIDNTRGHLGDLVAEVAAIPEAELELNFKDNATAPLQGALQPVMAASPYVVSLQLAILGNPIPLIQNIRSAIMELLSGSPYLVKVQSMVQSPVPELQAITQGVKQEATAQQTVFQTVTSAIGSFISSLNKSYAENAENIQVENATLGQDLQDTYNRLKNPLDGWVSHVWQKVGEYQEASGALQLENETLDSDMQTTFASIKRAFGTFKNETLPAWGAWASNVAESARLAFVNVAQNVYGGLKNAAENVWAWVKGTAQGFADWAKSSIRAFVSWGKNALNVIGNALSTAWQAIKDFFSGKTQSSTTIYSDLPIQTVDFTQSVFGGNIPMLPAWAGIPFPIPVFADGGMHDFSMGSLFVAGEAGAEIVTNMGNGRTGVMNVDQMEAAVANGNMGVINAVYAMANMVVRAVESIDVDVSLDGESLANRMYRYNQSAAKRYGGTMVEA